jgi:RHS repeat-associated protein
MIKVSGGAPGTVLYMYDEEGHLLGEYSSAGALVQETVWLGDIPVATLRPHSGGGIDTYYVHTDHLNTPHQITRPSDNAQMWTWFPAAFGDTAPTGTLTYNLRFPGQIYDSQGGLFQNYFRDYDPAVGRYVESDPIGLEGSLSTYEYADSNPTEMVDPYGLQAIPVPIPRLVPMPAPSPGTVDYARGRSGGGTNQSVSQAMEDSGADRAEIARPFGRGRVWCLVRCQKVENIGPGQGKGVSTIGISPWIYGMGFGADAAEAWNNALDAANYNTPLGCQKRHCQGKAGACKNWKGGKI